MKTLEFNLHIQLHVGMQCTYALLSVMYTSYELAMNLINATFLTFFYTDMHCICIATEKICNPLIGGIFHEIINFAHL